MNSSNKYLLSIITILGREYTTENKTDKNPYLHGADILVRDTINEYIKCVVCQTVVSIQGKNKTEGRQKNMYVSGRRLSFYRE